MNKPAIVKPVKIDMTVTTDDIINVHIAKLEATLHSKKADYQAQLREKEKELDKTKREVTNFAQEHLEKLAKKIPKEFKLKPVFRDWFLVNNAKSGLRIDIEYSFKSVYDRELMSVDVSVLSVVVQTLIKLDSEIKEIKEKIVNIGLELGKLPLRERQYRAEISRRKMENIDGIDKLLDLSDIDNPMLSLPANL